MKDITQFLSASTIRPEMTVVYVTTNKDGIKVAVATDSFKLVEYVLPDYLQEHMPTGWYSREVYKTLVKLFKKKTLPIVEVMDTLNFNSSLQERYKDYSYPEYKNIIPKDEELQVFDPTFMGVFRSEHLLPFFELIGEEIDFAQVKQVKKRGMIIYKSDTVTILLMPINR